MKKLKVNGIFVFSILKYIEIAITSFTTFLLAKKLGPSELGKAMPILLYITYANYLALGLNQAVTKNFSRIDSDKRVTFIALNLQYLIIVSVINLLFAYIFLDSHYALLTSIVSIFTIFRGFFFSYYRSVDKIMILNYNNICFSLLILISVYFFVSNLWIYLFVWSLLLIFSCLQLALNDKYFFNRVLKSLFDRPKKSEIVYNLSEGLKLAIAGLITTFFVTCDRFIINLSNFSNEIKGTYQLADYCGMAIYMLSTTIIFFFYPKWISSIRTSIAFRQVYLKFIVWSFLLYPIILIPFFIVGFYLIPIVFPEYHNLLNFSLGIIFSKIGVVLLSFISLYFIGLDKERKYIFLTIVPIIIIVLFVLSSQLFGISNPLIIPLFVGGVLLISSVFIIIYLKLGIQKDV